jgi:alkyl sulfatase BDS1-like metallo-beta-lactamase superfamily hydrolase
MSPEDVFDVMAARLNHPKVDGIKLGINVSFTDTGEKYALELSNSVLNNTRGRVLADAAASLSLTRAALLKMVSGSARLPDLLGSGEVKLVGEAKALGVLFGNLDSATPLFNIVTP